MSTPAICVIIPTFNRRSALARCLDHLDLQTSDDFEVLIVDDGSTDGTADLVRERQANATYSIRYLHQENSGPARGRNRAIREAETWLSVLIGDDIFVSPTFVERHVAFHRAHTQENVVALGLVNWCEDGQKVTRFMQWLNEDGIQFQFHSLLAGEKPDWPHFYTSNLSFKTNYLKPHPFDESFKAAAFEDMELGLRLSQRFGLDLHFLPEAVGEHLHPMTYVNSCRRMQKVGECAYTFETLWPEFGIYPPLSLAKRRALEMVAQPAILGGMTKLAALLTRFWCPNPMTKRLLTLHGRIGFERAKTEASLSKA